ncbi:protein ALP1-like [Venturia canescens]|uniref:protein ALP1-like n=1 Tax=Venturia canescens TaxID=32260 RepID=UPI001C9D44DB|nr:protein ALP1-like [Venturia canescens]
MTPMTFESLEVRLSPEIFVTNDTGRPMVPARIQLLSVLWLLATPDSYRSVADRFGMGKSSLSNCFVRVIKALNNIAGDIIIWPTGDTLQTIKEKFRETGGLPDVIGAIDGTDIEVKGPKENKQYYINRKKRFSITSQAVSDSQLRFTDCYAGFAGSVGDLRIFRNSDLWHAVRENRRAFFPDQEYIIADKAYHPVMAWCIPPYRNIGNLTLAQQRFNQTISKMRQAIERSFALLKGRWRRLQYLDMNRDDLIPFTIIACCVLHNICLDGVDDVDDFINEGQENVPNDRIIQENVPNDAESEAKRNYLVTLVT